MKFTYVERLFMSGRWYNKCFAHIILMSKPFVFLVGCAAVVSLVVGVLYGLLEGVTFLMQYLVTHNYISKTAAIGITAALILLVFMLPPIIKGISKEVQENSTRLRNSIQSKINHGKTQTGIDSEN